MAIKKVIAHSNHLVVVRDDGADLIDPITNSWQRFPTQRAAKWSATVYSRLRQGFGFAVIAGDLLDLKAAELSKTATGP